MLDPKNSVVLPLSGAVMGAGISSTVGGMGLAGSFGAVSVGMGTMAVAGAVTGATLYGGLNAISEGDTVALGAVGLGAMGGATFASTVGGMGLVGGFGGVSLGMGAMATAGGVVGLGVYGIYKLLNSPAQKESFAQTFARTNDNVSLQEFYNEAWVEVNPAWGELQWKARMMEIEVEEELQALKAKLQRETSPACSFIFFQFVTLPYYLSFGYNALFPPNSTDTLSKKNPAVWECDCILKGHIGAVNDVTIQGNIIASASDDKTVKLWDLETGKPLFTFYCPHKNSAVAISPNGNLLVAGDLGQNIISWNIKTRSLHKLYHKPSSNISHTGLIFSIVFSANGDTLASGSADKTIQLWNPITGQPQRALYGHTDAIHSLAFSPNEDILVSGSADKTIRLWTVENGTLSRIFTGHSRSVRGVAIHPHGEIIASGSDDTTVKLWYLKTGKLMQTLRHSEGIWSLAFSPDGEILASGSLSGTVRLWSLETGKVLQVLSGCHPVAFSHDGKRLVTGGKKGMLKIWKLNLGLPPTFQETLSGEWWEVLGVNENAPTETVKVAYRRLVKQYHPDINSSEKAKAYMQRINEAYKFFQLNNI